MIKILMVSAVLVGAACLAAPGCARGGAASTASTASTAPGPLPRLPSCGDEARCERECDGNVASSCVELGALLLEAKRPGAIERADALLHKACALKDGAACELIGDLYAETPDKHVSATRYYEKAVAMVREACDRGDARDCYRLGMAHLAGKPGPKAPAAASRFLSLSCDAARYMAAACGVLAHLYATGKGVAADPSRAFAMATRGCEGGDAESCVHRGLALAAGQGVAKDEAAAMALLRTLCDAGTGSACSYAANAYATGEVVAKNGPRAVALAERGCALMDARSCVMLGLYHEQGELVPEAPAKAARAYELACRRLDQKGCVGLGRLYTLGNGVATDLAKAKSLLEGACRANAELGCTWLGIALFLEGKDGARAKQLLEAECAADSPAACLRTADGYRTGLPGWPPDPAAAKAYLEKSCKLGGKKACELAGLPPP